MKGRPIATWPRSRSASSNDRPIDALAGDVPFHLNTVARPWMPRPAHPRRAAVSAFGFGGSNFHCVLEEHGTEKSEVDWDGDVQIAALSASTVADLRRQLDAWPATPTWDDFRYHADRSRRAFAASAAEGAALMAEADRRWGGSLRFRLVEGRNRGAEIAAADAMASKG